MKRPRLKTKLTKNNRIMGRPYGNADTLVSDMPKDPTAGRYDSTLWIIHAATGKGVRGFADERKAELRSEGVEIDRESVRRQLRKTRSRLSSKTKADT